MAEGLSIPALSPGPNQGYRRGLTNQPRAPGEERSLQNDLLEVLGTTGEDGFVRDVLEFGGNPVDHGRIVPPGGFQLDENGFYRFSRFSSAAAFDLSFSQSTVQVSSGEGANLFASVTEINISISVSAEFEQALIEAGRGERGDVEESFRNTAAAVVNRFVAREIQARLNFSLSFSQSTLEFNSAGEGLEDLSAFAEDGSLAGFLTLIRSFFGDDEKFDDFVNQIEDFLQSVGTAGDTAPVESVAPPSVFAGEGSGQAVYQSTSLEVSLDLSFESTTVQISSQAEGEDPIVLDLDGDGIELTSPTSGVRFDIDADGSREKTAFPTGGDGFLVLDRDGNGLIDDGRELFGDQNGAANGFEELARFDVNNDRVIDRRDSVFDRLKVFVDRNLDGVSQPGELQSLKEVGITSIALQYREVFERTTGENVIAQRSEFTRDDGSRGAIVDALLDYLA